MTGDGLTTWLGERRFAGKVVARIGRRGTDLVAEFPSAGTLLASEGGTRCHFEPAAGIDEEALNKLRTTIVDALVRHAQGKITLHGGAVCFGQKAIAFLGASGSGKSTLAAALCTSHDMQLVADDTVALEIPDARDPLLPITIVPTQSAAWLLPDARSALGLESVRARKASIRFAPPPPESVRLTAVFGLVFDPDARVPELRRVRGTEAFALLSDSSIRFVIDDPAAQVREFEQLRVLAERCPVYEFRRPRELSDLKHSVEFVERTLRTQVSEDAR